MQHTLIRLSILMLLPLLITGCNGKNGSFDIRKPASLDLTPPPGPPEYEQGWSDGCESGMNAYAHDFYKSLRVFDLRLDPVLRQNRMYYQVWKDAFLYCAIYYDSAINSRKL